MKKFVLAFLLLFYIGRSYGQNVSPKEIVRKSFLKTTGGRKVNSFKLVTTFDRPGTDALKQTQRSPMRDLMEELMSIAPDSVKEQMATEMKRASETLDQELVAMHERLVDISFTDLSLKKAANLRIGLTGAQDTSRAVTELRDGKMAAVLLNNPVLMLQYMASDTVELHYTGATVSENEDQHIIQVKVNGKWLDVMIGKESRLVSRIVIPRVDTDPLMGKGPVHYQENHVFSNYKKISGLLLPSGLEETSTSFGVTVRYNLAWSHINEVFPDSTFAREPTPEEKARFRFTDMGNNLFLMELTGWHSGSARTLVVESNQVVDLFTGFIYNEEIIGKMRKALDEKFPGKKIRNIFGIEAISWVQALSGLFDTGTELYYPKGLGLMSEDQRRRYNPKEDSIWNARLSDGTLHSFETDFEKDGYRIFMLNSNPNPNYEKWEAGYYLSSQKVIYVNGYLGNAKKGRSAAPWEKRLYEMITREGLAVEKIICPNALARSVPLSISYEELRLRIAAQ
ncbi:MAG: hypothetical protein J7619_24205 [Dyadobacter sp.]|uniref:hypothetical protein n=1 Tax=Dyadobacter sp. TaxID=1914288 RepID=UPI001B0D5E91|nr:hypothetical protein [Dyadobacter sp.]MBO9615821.1 hypothetical protein [Dyadobacter sp.]